MSSVLFLDLSPLKKYREYRLLFVGQTVSSLGSMITYVALPWQVYELTASSFLVGLLGAVQVVPLLVFGLLGGSVADAMDRRRLLWVSEAVLAAGALALAANACLPRPDVSLIFVIAAIMQGANGFHRPAMDAMTQKLVEPRHYAAVAALGTLRYSLGAVLGPAIGGWLITMAGVKAAYLVDFLTFLIALVSVWRMLPMPVSRRIQSHGSEIVAGLKYALGRPELMGTYIVDLVAMTFAFPVALFPAMGEKWGGAGAAGLLFSAMSVGVLANTIFSRWTGNVRRHGAYVIVAAALWGVFIAGLGLASNFHLALLFLALAGFADSVSGVFRGVIWNETVPNEMRGRLSGIEMISYMTGPLLGNTRAGWMASATSIPFSITSGGVVCIAGVVICAFVFSGLWRYQSVRKAT